VSGPARGGVVRSGDRRRGRVAALQMLYQWEVGRLPMPEVRRMFWAMDEADRPGASDRVRTFAATLADGTVEHVAEIDPLIEQCAEHWRIERMPVVDRLILRLAVYEFLHQPDTPQPVVIDEALELARQFSTPDAVKFVNGVLDGVRRRLQPDTSTRV
jgi:transcription antitermination protein NusB